MIPILRIYTKERVLAIWNEIKKVTMIVWIWPKNRTLRDNEFGGLRIVANSLALLSCNFYHSSSYVSSLKSVRIFNNKNTKATTRQKTYRKNSLFTDLKHSLKNTWIVYTRHKRQYQNKMAKHSNRYHYLFYIHI